MKRAHKNTRVLDSGGEETGFIPIEFIPSLAR